MGSPQPYAHRSTAIKPIISAAISSDVRRVPHTNMEKNGISGLSRLVFSIFYSTA